MNRGSPWRGSGRRLGSFGPAGEARTSTCCLRLAVGILVIHGREDVKGAGKCRRSIGLRDRACLETGQLSGERVLGFGRCSPSSPTTALEPL